MKPHKQVNAWQSTTYSYIHKSTVHSSRKGATKFQLDKGTHVGIRYKNEGDYLLVI